MRILIYSETQAAKDRMAELRAEGHHASLRNPQYFNPAQFDRACDLAIADDPVILASYSEATIKTERLTPEAAPEKPKKQAEPPAENKGKPGKTVQGEK